MATSVRDSRRILLDYARRPQDTFNRAHQALRVLQHHLVKLAPLLLVNIALLQRLQIQPDGSDGRLQLVGHSIQEAVLLLVAAHLAHQKNRVEDDSGDDEAEEDDAQNQGTISRQLRMIQLVLSTVAATAMHTPSVMKNAMVVLRLVMRMGIGRGQDSRGRQWSVVSIM